MRRIEKGSWHGIVLCLAVLLLADSVSAASETERLVDTAKKAYESTAAAFDCGISGDPERLHLWSCRWLDAELGASDSQTKSASAYSAHLERMKALSKKVSVKEQTGAMGVAPEHVDAVAYYLAEAEEWLKEGKQKAHH